MCLCSDGTFMKISYIKTAQQIFKEQIIGNGTKQFNNY